MHELLKSFVQISVRFLTLVSEAFKLQGLRDWGHREEHFLEMMNDMRREGGSESPTIPQNREEL